TKQSLESEVGMWIDVSFSHGKRFLMYEPGVEYFYGFDVVCEGQMCAIKCCLFFRRTAYPLQI
ncbi:MAG: hypothetical protein UDM12_03615, partial [Prevotellamassilia sp.]|nr:hypothetical protein [Prevotellamassilia sp.]